MKENCKELESFEVSQKHKAYLFVKYLMNCPDTDLSFEYAFHYNLFSKWDFASDVLKGSQENRTSYYFEKYVLHYLEDYIVSAYLCQNGYSAHISDDLDEWVKKTEIS